jgi:hypothetical protein
MNTDISPDKANRLAVGLAKARNIPYEQAEKMLKSLSLRIVADPQSCHRASAQAALLTALNTAYRAFLGGVEVQLPANVPLKLALPAFRTLNDALAITGYTPVNLENPTITVYLGKPPTTANDDDVIIHCDGWRGGASDVGAPEDFKESAVDDFALGGIFAGGLAIHRCFVKCTSLSARCLEGPFGMSLWEPQSDWRIPTPDAHLSNLPIRFWLLGLGHLGQAFAWNLAFLPFPKPSEVELLLHDYDMVDESNRGSGLLCAADSVGKRKTRHCARWLENFGFRSTVTERRFGEFDRRDEREPLIAFCGFDKIKPRLHLDTAGFGYVVECGLGGHLADFDQAEFHVFPNARYTARDVWGKIPETEALAVNPEVAALFGGKRQVCGQQAIDVAGKTVSTSFVGAMAGAIAVSELLRTFNHGQRYDKIVFNARCKLDWIFDNASLPFRASQLGQMGFSSMP